MSSQEYCSIHRSWYDKSEQFCPKCWLNNEILNQPTKKSNMQLYINIALSGIIGVLLIMQLFGIATNYDEEQDERLVRWMNQQIQLHQDIEGNFRIICDSVDNCIIEPSAPIGFEWENP